MPNIDSPIAPAWQPSFVIYARHHAKTPEEMLAHDAERFPGGKMCGYNSWVMARWGEWDRLKKQGARIMCAGPKNTLPLMPGWLGFRCQIRLL